MEEDSRMTETKSVGIVDGNGAENDLILELSIGGIFGNSKQHNQNVNEQMRKVNLNVQSKREIQTHRRQELRRKREENLKKLETYRTIVGQNDDVVEIEPVRKKERVGDLPENVGSIPTAPIRNATVDQKVMPVCSGVEVVQIDEDVNTKNSVFRPTVCRSFRPFQGNLNKQPEEEEIDGGERRNCKVNSIGSTGGASSTYSDGQCSSHQGGTTDDSRSNSINSQLDPQLPTHLTSIDPFDPSDQPTGSSVSEPTPIKPNEPSISNNPPSKPETRAQQAQNSFLARMPCVSTTGNGSNGKTIGGFLYKYTKNEVSIVCVCHGESFSPAGFVEHAGGVDIVHPLKHITIFPTAFGSTVI